MLAQTIVVIAMIALIATSAVAGIAGYARAETATAARALVDPAIDAALSRYDSAVLAPAVAASFTDGDGGTPPAIAAALNGGTAWMPQQVVFPPTSSSSLAVVVDIAPTSIRPPACQPASGSADLGADIEIEGQCSTFVQESRLSLTITADAGPLIGPTSVSTLARVRRTVTLRLFAQPPYVMVAGSLDDPAPDDPHEGDLGGYAGPLGTFGPPAASDDTTIHVLEACTPSTGDCSASDPAPRDDPTSLPWTNGNVNPSS